MLSMHPTAIRTRGWAWVLAVVAACEAPEGAAAPEAPGIVTAVLVESELRDPDLVPPECLPTLEELAEGRLVPAPKIVTVRPTGLVVDWDGDGRSEANVRQAKVALVRVTKDGRAVPLLLAYRGGGWRAAPAALLSGKVGGSMVELLDADLDGRYDGAEDRLRWAGGGFHRPAPERRLGTARGLARWSLAREAETWRFTLTPEALPEGASASAIQGLLAVNAYRNRSGLAPLTLNLLWCAGCQKHAEYIRLQPVEGFGHEELPGRPGYSVEGRTAAQEGVMERTGDPARAVERLTSMMMHRTPFLCDPSVGLGVGAVGAPATVGRNAAVGAPGFCVLRAGQALASKDFPVLAPAPGQRDVPLALLEELPAPDRQKSLYGRPRGFPVSLSFLPSDERGPRLTLRVVGQREPVPSVVFTPALPIHASFAHNYASAFLVAEDPLLPETTYEVRCDLGTAASARSLVWRFTTAAR